MPRPVLTEQGYVMLKLADMLDLILSCKEEMYRGNTYAEDPYQTGLDKLEEMALPPELYARCMELVEEL